MKNLVVLLGLVALVTGAVFYTGCNGRLAVLQDKVMGEIDKLLNELDVKEKQIEQKRAGLEKDLQKVVEQRAEASVRVKQAGEQVASLQGTLKDYDGKLGRMKTLLQEVESQGELTRNGVVYKPEDLNRMATDLIAQRENTSKLLASVETSQSALKRSYDFLQKQESAAKDTLANLDRKIAEIKSKKEAVNVVRKASASTASGDGSLMNKLKDLDKEIAELDVNIETRMLVEEERMNEMIKSSQSFDDLLAEPADLNSTRNQIEAILGGGEKKEGGQ